MKKILIIIQREYISRVKKRSFILTTLLAPIGFLLLLASNFIINSYTQTRTDVAIVDDSGLFKNIPLPDADDNSVYFHKIDDSFDHVVQQLPKGKHDDAKFQAVIFVPRNFDIERPNAVQIEYRYMQRPGLSKREFINQRFTAAIQKLRLAKMNITGEQMEHLGQNVKLRFSSLDNTKEARGYADAAVVAGMIMGFGIYISLLFYGTMIMRGVMEEKTNRIVELLASSVKPFQLLMGKIIGIGAVGLTQFLIWIILTVLTNIVAVPFIIAHMAHQPQSIQTGANQVDPEVVQAFSQSVASLPVKEMILLLPVYFLGGFLFYGAIFAAIGAVMGEDGDNQSLTMPVMVPIIISIIIAMNVMSNPDGSLGFWGSLIPFFSPVVMCALLPFNPPLWQIALSLVFLIGGFVLTTWMAARIYRTGILMYGKKVKFKEIGRWILARG